MTVAGLVLAAGAGTRFGAPKALADFGGERLVDRAVRTLHDAGCGPILVVLGAQAGQVVAAATLRGAAVLVNDGWSEGLGSSLRCGLTALTAHPVEAAVLLLVDQPRIGADVVRRLLAHRDGAAQAVVASYAGKPRNPVLLERSAWPDVAASAVGDVGARGWLRTHADRVRTVACDDLGSADDIDTPADLTRILEERP